MIKKMLISVGFILVCSAVSAEDSEVEKNEGPVIYQFRGDNGSTLLSNRESRYKELKLEKKTYYPDKDFNKKWEVDCKRDKFEGYKSCYITKLYSGIFIYYRSGKYSVLVGSSHYPNTQSAIKIDNNPPIYGIEGTSNTPLKVVEQLKNGKVAYTRYKEWPYEYNKDGDVQLEGFAEALEEMKMQYKSL